MPRTQGKNQGAGDTRDQIIEALERMAKGDTGLLPGSMALAVAVQFIKTMPKRAAEKPKGLGREKKRTSKKKGGLGKR